MKNDYLVILLKELVIFPNQEVKIELIADSSIDVVNESVKNNNSELLVVAPLSQKEENPNVNDLPKIGVIATITSKYVLENNALRVVLRGVKRVIINNYYNNKKTELLSANTTVLELPKYNENEKLATIRSLKKSIELYTELNSNVSNSIVSILEKEEDVSKMTDIITIFLPFNVDQKLKYMQMINPLVRGKSLLEDITMEIDVLKLEEEIEDKVRHKLSLRETDFLIKEKISELNSYLSTPSTEDSVFFEQLDKLKLEDSTYTKLKGEIIKYNKLIHDSSEASVLYNYLDTVLNLPWNTKSDEVLDVSTVKMVLDNTHYGLTEVKDRVLEHIEMINFGPNIHNPLICLVGPPGVGKTSIASSIAKATDRKFVKISVGGLNDSIELIGSRRTYLAAKAGKIISGIKKCGVNNPVILIDEVDKMVKSEKGDPASTLLEILDESQNNQFTDNYIEEPFDLSNCLFILTANNEDDINYILKDRIEILNINSYTFYEKEIIAKKYLIPRILNEYNSSDYKLNMSLELINYIINNYTYEAGVRELDRVLHKLIRKMILDNIKVASKKNVVSYLGKAKYDSLTLKTNVGEVNVLAYTNMGGTVLKIETSKCKGEGSVTLTGCLGGIMKESISVAYSYLRNRYRVDFKNNDLHIHFLSAAIKKDGPSAGTAITASMLSLYLNQKIDHTVAFTGEITLNGNILKIGAAKEKIVAAINRGIKKIYVPKENEIDLIDIPSKYMSELEIVYVNNFDEIYNDLFCK